MLKGPSRISAVCKARAIITDFGLEEPEHIVIERIAAALGVAVKQEPMRGADGRIVALGGAGIISIRESIRELEKKRFVIAHELGHFELHLNETGGIIYDENNFHVLSDRIRVEAEANFFAAELLMPEEMFKKRVDRDDLSVGLLAHLSATFMVSLTAAALRFVILRPEYALVCSSREGIRWFAADRDSFPYFINIRGKVHPDSLASDYFSGARLPERFFPVETHAWLERARLRGTLKELAIPLPRYGEVLNFLYVHED